MIGSVDVQYQANRACTGLVLFDDWSSGTPDATHVQISEVTEDYVPGEFYRRELPCIMSVIDRVSERPAFLLIDGYVWLGNEKKGLGAHLFAAVGESIIIVGVGKTYFQSDSAIEVVRGASARPLYVTAAGIDTQKAADHVRQMHGKFRLPTMLKLADQLARQELRIKSDQP